MFLTCAVRLLAIELTQSVRSFQTPLTSRTCAWPPSLPSVPTSRATRVTSEVNTPSCSIIVLTMVAERRNSPSSGRPSTSRRTVCSRSPLATAARARVTSCVGHSRSSISVLTDVSIAPQAPVDRGNLTRCRVLPCLPTTVPTRSSSSAILALAATMSLKVSAILPSTPVQWPGSRTEKSPSRTACRALSSCVTSDGGAVRAFEGWAARMSGGAPLAVTGGMARSVRGMRLDSGERQKAERDPMAEPAAQTGARRLEAKLVLIHCRSLASALSRQARRITNCTFGVIAANPGGRWKSARPDGAFAGYVLHARASAVVA